MAELAVGRERKPGSGFSQGLRRFAENRAALAGLIVLLLIALMGFIGPLVYPVNPFAIVATPMAPPGDGAPLGADYLGRDVLAGILAGARVSLFIGISATFCTAIIGTVTGSIAGYYGGKADTILMRITEFFQVLPPLLLSMVLVTLFSPSVLTVILSIGLVNWIGTARIVRAEFLRIKGEGYVLAERAMGAKNGRIIFRVILPSALPSLIVVTTLQIGIAILFAAALSFLGLTDPNVMTWGLMIGQSRPFIWQTWWAVTFPGIAIFMTVLSVSLIGDGLNEALNPRLRPR